MTPEQRARQQIDAMLVACGWLVQDYKSADFYAARAVALREVPLKTAPVTTCCSSTARPLA